MKAPAAPLPYSAVRGNGAAQSARSSEQPHGSPDRYVDPKHDLVAFSADGWFRTGDIAPIDADGYLAITDRKKDIIVRGGENISSMEVENLLLGLPEVSEAAVVAMPDERLGERICVYVIPKPDRELTLDRVVAHCADAGFAKQKTPKRLILVNEMSRTLSGKVKKAELRARLAHAGRLREQ